jgi:hypothetical protein
VASGDNANEVLFEVLTPLGFRVRIDRSRWELIVRVKHPVLAGTEEDVRRALAEPDEVRISRTDSAVYLFYRLQHQQRWVCAVCKRSDEEGFLITAYPTDAIKEGEHIWPR